MDFVVHVIVTSISLLIIARLLAGVEVDNLFTAFIAALIIGLIYALMAPLAEKAGRVVGELVAQTQIAYPLKMVVLALSMMAVGAVVLLVAAKLGPGFRISGFVTAMLAALLLVVLNALIGEVIDFAQAQFGNAEVPPPN